MITILNGLAGRDIPAEHGPPRSGDVRHSLADIGRAHARLGYAPTHTLQLGLGEALPWYVDFITSREGVQA
jgi:UDP-N-acetylglucosamine 4-epimerase